LPLLMLTILVLQKLLPLFLMLRVLIPD